MKYQATNVSQLENVGLIDTAIRGSLGMAILLFVPTISSTSLVGLTVITIYAGLNAFINRDPPYALVKGSHYQPVEKVSTPVGIKSRRMEHAFGGDQRKKAA